MTTIKNLPKIYGLKRFKDSTTAIVTLIHNYEISVPCLLSYDYNKYSDIYFDLGTELFNHNDFKNVNIVKCHEIINDMDLENCFEANIEPKIKNEVKTMINKYRDCFALNISELGYTDKAIMKINLKDDEPVIYRPYRLSPSQRLNVKTHIDEMLKLNIIRPSQSEYCSPIVVVKKKTGESRICIDYRKLNAKTIKDRFPIPNIDDCIQRLGRKKYFSTFDLVSGYYQIPVEENSIKFTSFVTPDGQYEFQRMLFGLSNAPSIFQRMMTRLAHEMDDNIVVFLDDVIISSDTIEKGLQIIERFLVKTKYRLFNGLSTACLMILQRNHRKSSFLGFHQSRLIKKN